MDEFDADNLKAIRVDILAALRQVGERHRLTFALDNITYGQAHFSVTMTCAIVRGGSGDGTPLGATHKWTIGWAKHAATHGLPPDLLGKKFTRGDGQVVIVAGLSPHTREPVILMKENGMCVAASVRFIMDVMEHEQNKEISQLRVRG